MENVVAAAFIIGAEGRLVLVYPILSPKGILSSLGFTGNLEELFKNQLAKEKNIQLSPNGKFHIDTVNKKRKSLRKIL